MAAVSRGDGVVALERAAHPDGDCLLTLVEVDRALDLVREEQPLGGVLEHADANHRLVAALELGLGEGGAGLGRHGQDAQRDGSVLDSRI